MVPGRRFVVIDIVCLAGFVAGREDDVGIGIGVAKVDRRVRVDHLAASDCDLERTGCGRTR